MDSIIYNPVEDYQKKFKELHAENTKNFFEELVKTSGVDIQLNKKTVEQYNAFKESLKKLKRKYNWLRFWRVLMCISLVLIPVVIWKTTPKIKALREDISEADKKADALYQEAHNQMLCLNKLFSDNDALMLLEKTLPQMNFEPVFSPENEADMIQNYDFECFDNAQQSATDVLFGRYNDNPFLFENMLVHTMGTETYHGYKTISWTEYYTDSNGKRRSRIRTQTLHATVDKPKPFYTNQVVLNYGSQSGPELSFSRDASHIQIDSEKELDRHVKRGEKKLKKLTDKAIKQNDDFVSMSNTEFEVLFDALDRDHEVQFRSIFTPLAQTNMSDVILSKEGYGDDFDFYKRKRMNIIVSKHSQKRQMVLTADNYISYSFEIVKENFINKNAEFFKAVYFDFAPLLAIPSYQERPVHSLKPIPDYDRLYSSKECEALANKVDAKHFVHPDTKTRAILKINYVGTKDSVETIGITAYSYDIEKRVDIVSVYGGDGHYHNVEVPWDEYLPLKASDNFSVTTKDLAEGKEIIGTRNNLCIFK